MRLLKPFVWIVLCVSLAVLCVAVWLLPQELQTAWRWRVDSWAGQPWQLWTASLVHLSDMHLFVNMLTLLCLTVIGWHAGAGGREALALLIAWPLSNVALLAWPQVQFYAGFSGLNHAIAGILSALFVIFFVVKRRWEPITFFLTGVLLARLLWESGWREPLRPDASWGFNVVQAAHLSGALSGALSLWLVYGCAALLRIVMTQRQVR